MAGFRSPRDVEPILEEHPAVSDNFATHIWISRRFLVARWRIKSKPPDARAEARRREGARQGRARCSPMLGEGERRLMSGETPHSRRADAPEPLSTHARSGQTVRFALSAGRAARPYPSHPVPLGSLRSRSHRDAPSLAARPYRWMRTTGGTCVRACDLRSFVLTRQVSKCLQRRFRACLNSSERRSRRVGGRRARYFFPS